MLVSTTVTGMPAAAKHIAMPPPMVPAPITAARFTSRALEPAMSGTLAASRSAKKIWRWAFDWSPATSSRNSCRSSRERIRDRKRQCAAQRFHRRGRGILPLRALDVRRRSRFEDRDIVARLRKLVVAVAHQPQRPPLGCRPPCERDGGGQEITRHHVVHQAGLVRLRGADRFAGEDHRHGLIHADQPRQPLRAAGARDDAELDLRQPETRARRGDAEMAGERQFQPTPERGPVQGRNDRLADGLDRRNDVGQHGLARRLAELGDVGAGDEGAPRTGNHDCRHGRIAASAHKHVLQRSADAMAQRVDGGIGDGDDRHVAVISQISKVGQSVCSSWGARRLETVHWGSVSWQRLAACIMPGRPKRHSWRPTLPPGAHP